MSQKFHIQSPTRVDLAGGTLDMWPLYNFVHGAKTVNVAIDIYTEAALEPRSDSKIIFESPDLKARIEYQSFQEAMSDQSGVWALNQSVIRFFKPEQGFQLITRSQSPVGGGLGGSSSLTITLLKTFSQWLKRPFPSTHQMVHVAHNMEAELLNTPTGTQDYYPAVSGGVNILSYGAEGIDHKVLTVDGSELSSNFMLIYTGKAHHSGLNNFEVLKKAVARDKQTLQALRQIKEIAEATAKAVENRYFHLLPELFVQEYSARTLLCEDFSSDEIRTLHKLSLEHGAQALKICGAGGGGCVLVWCAPQNQESVRSACQRAGFQVLAAKPVRPL
ncbi:MAG: galactokinase [Bdellovibrionia bacterium]